ncbi:unnamed protein product [Gadus morhua 'NCC']
MGIDEGRHVNDLWQVSPPAPPARVRLRRSLVTVPAGAPGPVPVRGAAVTGLLMNTKERRKSDAPTERAEEKEEAPARHPPLPLVVASNEA